MQTVVLFIGNNPSAGSPTETLLRLLLPLDQGCSIRRSRPASRSRRSVGRSQIKLARPPVIFSLARLCSFIKLNICCWSSLHNSMSFLSLRVALTLLGSPSRAPQSARIGTEQKKSHLHLSICQSFPCPVRVSFQCWVKLSRRLHSWWCPSVNSFKVQLCNHTPPGRCPAGHGNNAAGSLVGIIYGRNYDGIWSSSNFRLSFLINENILDQYFRFRPSRAGPRMSPPAAQSECPRRPF